MTVTSVPVGWMSWPYTVVAVAAKATRKSDVEDFMMMMMMMMMCLSYYLCARSVDSGFFGSLDSRIMVEFFR